MNINEILRSELESRCQRNERYSLRSFARFLEIDPPTLSKILNNQKQPGSRLTKRLANRIGIEPSVTETLIKNPLSLKNLPKAKAGDYRLIEDDQFHAISHWYYYAILEILEIDDAIHTLDWISKKLGISKPITKTAIDRMARLGFVEKKNRKWIDKTGGKTTALGKELTSAARRIHQKELLQKGIEALEATPIDLRDQSSMTMAINKSEIPKVKELVTEFRRNLSRYLNSSKNKDEVYNLVISFYPVTKPGG